MAERAVTLLLSIAWSTIAQLNTLEEECIHKKTAISILKLATLQATQLTMEGLYIHTSGRLQTANSFFSDNKAYMSGGVMDIYKSSIITIQSSYFAWNMARFGGVSLAFHNNQSHIREQYFLQ